jgi:Domain of unknown function (DUF3883)
MDAGNGYMRIGDELVTSGDVREAIDWLDRNMDSEHDTFTGEMKRLKNPLSKWSAGRVYKDLQKNANKVKIRAFLWEKLGEFEAVAGIRSAGVVATGSGQGFAVDQKDKVAVEMRAMEAARAHYQDKGWCEDESQKDAYKHQPFDLVLNKDGQVKHVEVKGTQQKFNGIAKPEIAIFLTANEVDHARKCKVDVPCHSVELFILTDVEMGKNQAGEPLGTGGNAHVRDFSKLNDERRLKPIAFRYIA